jgi:arsenite-transporting ATPase
LASTRGTASKAFDSLATRHVLLFGGKGGVGKTTISIAAALHFSRSRKTILFTSDPASNLSDFFDNPTTRQPDNLQIESLHAEDLYAKFLKENLANFLELGDRGTYLDKEELRRFFELSLPGVDELMAWMHIGELAEENTDAMLIVDTAPTGHTLRMLGAAEHFRQFAEALESMQEKHRDMVRQFTRRNVRDALDEFIEQFEERARRRRELLTDSARTAFLPVFLSETWVVEQTKRLIAEVRADGLDVPLAILNRAAADCDCARCREHARRDDEARKALALTVVDAPRSCMPLDTSQRISDWSAGRRPAGPPAAGPAAVQPASRRRASIRRLTFLAGKGGVGKTTCAASIALQLADERRVTAMSVDPAHTLRDVFAGQPPPPNLSIEIVDTREKWRTFRDSLGEEIERAIGALTPRGVSVSYDTEAMRKLVEIAPPGADELFAITRLADLIADQSRETIIVDTAPTGHFLRLVDLPKSAGEWVKEFMRILLRYRELIPPGSLAEELIRASRALHSVDEMLRSVDCGVIVVTRPERVVIGETRRLIDQVAQRGMHLTSIIANYVTPETDCSCDRSMRRYEVEALGPLGKDIVVIERRDAPVTSLAELKTLVPLE